MMRSSGLWNGVPKMLATLGMIAEQRGDFDEARALHHRALRASRISQRRSSRRTGARGAGQPRSRRLRPGPGGPAAGRGRRAAAHRGGIASGPVSDVERITAETHAELGASAFDRAFTAVPRHRSRNSPPADGRQVRGTSDPIRRTAHGSGHDHNRHHHPLWPGSRPRRPPAALRVTALTKTYGRGDAQVRALHNVDLSFRPASFTAVMGPSGCGKSTFLHTSAGLDTPTSGSVTLDGIELTTMNEVALTKLRRQRIGFVFQAFNLLPALTVHQNIRSLGGHRRHRSRL